MIFLPERLERSNAGNVFKGTDFLGLLGFPAFRSSLVVLHAKGSVDKLGTIVREAKKEMRKTFRGGSSNQKCMHYQSPVKLRGLVWGWSQSFRHTTARHVFVQLDKEVDRAMAEITTEATRLARSGPPEMRRRLSGIHLLADTPNEPLPDVGSKYLPGAPRFPMRAIR